MTALLDAALAYARDLGWQIFPIEPATKRPYSGTRGFRDATSDEEQIRAWWGVEPDAWIGLALRPSGLIAIDYDISDGKVGAATLAALEAKFGPLPRDLVQRSNSGGGHIVMLDPSPGPTGWTRTADEGGEIRGKADKLGCGPHVDIKCNGYILLEPSGRYQWQTFGDAPPVPEAWLAALRKPAAELGAAPDSEGLEAWAEPSDPAPLPAADRERLRADLRGLGPRAQGGGTTFAAVLRIFHDYGLSLEDGYPFLLEWNAACGRPRPEHELHRQIRNIAEGGRATGKRGNRRSDLSRIQAIVRAAYDYRAVAVPDPPTNINLELMSAQAATENVNPEPPSGPWLPPPAEPEAAPEAPAGVFGELLEAAAQAVLDRKAIDTTAPASITPMFETARSLRARRFPPAPWLVQGLLTRGGVATVSGEPKSTKSWAATELVIAVASGTPAFGKYAVPVAGRAAYFYAEDVGASVQTRLNALIATRARMPADWDERLIVQPRGRVIDLTKPLDLAVIIASVRMFGPVDLLVLDPLRDIHSGKEDSSDEMRPVMEAMRVIGDILGCAVLFVHHAAKASADSGKRRAGQRMRGSGAVHGALDCGLHMWDLRGDEKNQFTVAVTSEIKAAQSAGTFDLRLDIVDGKHGTAERATWSIAERAKEEPKTAGKTEPGLGDVLMCLFDHGSAPMNVRSIHAKVRGSQGVVMAVVAAAARDGYVSEIKAGTASLGFALTEKGTKAVQQGSNGLQPAPASPHPATAAICNLPPEEKA